MQRKNSRTVVQLRHQRKWLRRPIVTRDILVVPGGQPDFIAVQRRAVEHPASILSASDLPILIVRAQINFLMRTGEFLVELQIYMRPCHRLAAIVNDLSGNLCGIPHLHDKARRNFSFKFRSKRRPFQPLRNITLPADAHHKLIDDLPHRNWNASASIGARTPAKLILSVTLHPNARDRLLGFMINHQQIHHFLRRRSICRPPAVHRRTVVRGHAVVRRNLRRRDSYARIRST